MSSQSPADAKSRALLKLKIPPRRSRCEGIVSISGCCLDKQNHWAMVVAVAVMRMVQMA